MSYMCTTVVHEEQYCFFFVVLVVESRFFLHVSYCRTCIVQFAVPVVDIIDTGLTVQHKTVLTYWYQMTFSSS